MKKRILSFLLAVTLVLSCIPFSVFAQEAAVSAVSDCVIEVDSGNAMPGEEEVRVSVTIQNNPGILGAVLKLSWEEGLTLTAVENGSAFSALSLTGSKPPRTENANFNWYATQISDSQVKDGEILGLTFAVSEDAAVDEKISITASYEAGAIFDRDKEYVSPVLVSGGLQIISYKPGDATGDLRVNALDLVNIAQYIADGCTTDPYGYNVSVNESASDVNDDGRINAMDLVNIAQYIADGCTTDPDGYNIKLCPATPKCAHELKAISSKAATCEEEGNLAYWQCTLCDTYFKDANALTETTLEKVKIDATGHDAVIDPAVEPTYTQSGKTEGSHCGVCGKVLVAQENIAPIEGFSIHYEINPSGDNYLAQQEIDRSDFVYSYTPEDETFYLPVPSVPGYTFGGWYDAPGDISGTGGNQVVTIEKGSTGNKKFYARWILDTFNVEFESDLIPEESITYQVNKEKVLPSPKLEGYIFAGWSDDEGNILKKIPVGTVGHKTYSANWISERNQAWAKKKLDDPIIYEDSEVILYTYEIGEIRNVPLYVIHDFGKINSNGVTKTETKTYSTQISTTLMEQYGIAASKATTDSFNWTLSSAWSEGITIDEQWAKENGLETTEAREIATNESGEWYVSSGSSGTDSTETIDTTETHDLTTTTHNTKTYDVTDKETRQDFSAGLNLNTKSSYGVKASIDVVDINGGREWGGALDLKYSNGVTTNKKTGTEDDDGTVEEDGTITVEGTNTTNSSSWNKEAGYSGSSSVSETQAISKALSEKISQTYGYGKNYIQSEDQSQAMGYSSSTNNSEEYSSSTTYSKIVNEEVTKTYTTENTMSGYHRWIMAGTAHVFAIVGYDIATESYFVTNFTVMDDEMHEFEDYSYSYASYDDNQNGVIPFEVPIEIIEHVSDRVDCTDGLQVSKSGVVTAYTGEEDFVIIPEYKVIKNSDGTSSVIKITGISSDVFYNNKNIKVVELSEYITEIPENAFFGCASLISVEAKSITEIGVNAFAGCTSLKYCSVGDKLVTLGAGAFSDVESLYVKANNAKIAQAAINTGAKTLVIAVSDKCTDLENMTLEIPEGTEEFVFYGYGREYSELIIKSNAKKTEINRATLTSRTTVPLTLCSEEIILQEVNVTAPAIAFISSAESATVSLYGESNIVSTNENAVLCKTIQINQIKDDYYSALNIAGNVLVCGEVDKPSYLKFTKGSLKTISATDFDNYFAGFVTLTFNANGGTVSETTRQVNCGMAVGTLPTPTRTGFGFDGWYDAAGNKVTADKVYTSSQDIALTAKWAVNAYTLSYEEVWGYTITVKRTSSPNAGAPTGTLSSGSAIYYGDVLSVSYSPLNCSEITSHGVTSITVTRAVTKSDIYASYRIKSYGLSFSSSGTGYTITVKRTSSPYQNASIGTLSSGTTIYYGDVLSVTYTASTGYSITSKGATSITVTRNITSSDIYVNVSLNSYTYEIVYKSSNGTALGSTTATYKYGTTNTITPPAKSGYTTPSSQSVKWDSTSRKTITFVYTPIAASNPEFRGDFRWSPYIEYYTTMSYRNRTATSVEVMISTAVVIQSGWSGFGLGVAFDASCGSAGTGKVKIAGTGDLSSGGAVARGTSGWVTVPLNTTNATTLNFSANIYNTNWENNYVSHSEYAYSSYTWSMNIPAY